MNYYGFKIKSSHRSFSSDYLVIAENIEKAKELIQEQVSIMLNQKDGWIWGAPIINEILNVKELNAANLLWQ